MNVLTGHLVRAVEEGDVFLSLHELGKLCPLLLRRVHARRVVRASVKQEQRLVVRRLHVSQQTCNNMPMRKIRMIRS